MFEAITEKAYAVNSLTKKELFFLLFKDQGFINLIIQLNQKQLFDRGVDSQDKTLGTYSPNTIYGTSEYEGKISKGLPYDHVTLFDTGEFYKSFKVVWSERGDGEMIITANSIKEDGKDLLVEWGKDVLGLDEDSIEKLSDYARSKMREIMFTRLKLAA